jgi:hypothetical protein
LIVKPERHVTAVDALTPDEALELGPLLRLTSAGGVPVHIHYVVQPVTEDQMAALGAYGPALQVAMFANGEVPAAADVERVSEVARHRFTSG